MHMERHIYFRKLYYREASLVMKPVYIYLLHLHIKIGHEKNIHICYKRIKGVTNLL